MQFSPPRVSRQKGFTIMELMIAVAIVGIIAAVGYPAFNSHLAKASRSEAQQALMAISQRQSQYFMDAREYASSLDSSGLNMISSGKLSGFEAFTCSGFSCTSKTHEIFLSSGSTTKPANTGAIDTFNAGPPPKYEIVAIALDAGRNKGDAPLVIDNTNKKTGPWK